MIDKRISISLLAGSPPEITTDGLSDHRGYGGVEDENDEAD